MFLHCKKFDKIIDNILSCDATYYFWWILFQILGAFADPSGVPMQGMKIKNVVPGKDQSFFRSIFLVFGTFDRLRVPRHFALRIKTRLILPVSSFWLPFLVCGLKSFSKAGWDLFPSSVIMLKTKGTITASVLLARRYMCLTHNLRKQPFRIVHKGHLT